MPIFTRNLLVLVVLIGICIVIYNMCKHRSMEFRRKMLLYLCICNIVVYIVYKLILFFEISHVAYDSKLAYLLNCIPFHLCSINLIILPIALTTRSKWLTMFCFYAASLGASAAILFPDKLFASRSLLDPVNTAFIAYHSIVVISSISLGLLGLYRPSFKDMPKVSLMLAIVAGLSYLVNELFAAISGVMVNYFYSVSPQGNHVLGFAYNLVPIPYVYLLFFLIPLQGLMLIEILAFIPVYRVLYKGKTPTWK